jgi:hypothetical protein
MHANNIFAVKNYAGEKCQKLCEPKLGARTSKLKGGIVCKESTQKDARNAK